MVVVVSRWALGPRRRPQRDRLGSTRPHPGSRFASALAATGLGWPCSSVCGLFASCCQSGDPDAQKPREIGQAFCGGTGGEDGNLGPGCHCCPSDAGRVCLGGHQVRRPARKHAGVQGGRWMDIFCEREGGWSQEGEKASRDWKLNKRAWKSCRDFPCRFPISISLQPVSVSIGNTAPASGLGVEKKTWAGHVGIVSRTFPGVH